MNRHMNMLYLCLFQNFPHLRFLEHIENTKSVEFASVAICPRLTPILALQ